MGTARGVVLAAIAVAYSAVQCAVCTVHVHTAASGWPLVCIITAIITIIMVTSNGN